VLETVTLVLELAGRPMRAYDIHAAANELLGRPVRWSSVKGFSPPTHSAAIDGSGDLGEESMNSPPHRTALRR
jgi:hypothetical protein